MGKLEKDGGPYGALVEPRASWPILEDVTSQAGLPLHKVAQDDALSGKNAAAFLGFKNSLGKLRYPKVDGEDRLIVSGGASDDYAYLSMRGEKDSGSATLALVTGCDIDLVADLTYRDVGFIVSCFRDAHFQIVQVNNLTETILADILVDSGAPTITGQITALPFAAGSTGVQKLKLLAKNENALSALRGTLTVTEVQPTPAP